MGSGFIIPHWIAAVRKADNRDKRSGAADVVVAKIERVVSMLGDQFRTVDGRVALRGWEAE